MLVAYEDIRIRPQGELADELMRNLIEHEAEHAAGPQVESTQELGYETDDDIPLTQLAQIERRRYAAGSASGNTPKDDSLPGREQGSSDSEQATYRQSTSRDDTNHNDTEASTTKDMFNG